MMAVPQPSQLPAVQHPPSGTSGLSLACYASMSLIWLLTVQERPCTAHNILQQPPQLISSECSVCVCVCCASSEPDCAHFEGLKIDKVTSLRH